MENHLPKFECPNAAALALFTALAACTVPVEDTTPTDAVGSVEQKIEGGTIATAPFFQRAAIFFGSKHTCSATKIAPSFVLTAAHCLPAKGDKVAFYPDSAVPDLEHMREVASAFIRPGVAPVDGEWAGLYDSNGHFADIAVLELKTPDTGSPRATLQWEYPGWNFWGTRVGSGEHNGLPNPSHQLDMIKDTTYSDSDSDGHFLTSTHVGDSGDSGGPFYHDWRLTGVHAGGAFDWGSRDSLTSVHFHLDWILAKIGWTWPGQPVQKDVMFTGNAPLSMGISGESHKICQYACERTTACVGYTFVPSASYCEMFDSVTGTMSTSGNFASSALK